MNCLCDALYQWPFGACSWHEENMSEKTRGNDKPADYNGWETDYSCQNTCNDRHCFTCNQGSASCLLTC